MADSQIQIRRRQARHVAERLQLLTKSKPHFTSVRTRTRVAGTRLPARPALIPTRAAAHPITRMALRSNTWYASCVRLTLQLRVLLLYPLEFLRLVYFQAAKLSLPGIECCGGDVVLRAQIRRLHPRRVLSSEFQQFAPR